MALRNARLTAEVIPDAGRRLVVTATDASAMETFSGEISSAESSHRLIGALNAQNAAALRAEFTAMCSRTKMPPGHNFWLRASARRWHLGSPARCRAARGDAGQSRYVLRRAA